ncbi:hypothetical protein [Dactylosporangium sp. CA-092794]
MFPLRYGRFARQAPALRAGDAHGAVFEARLPGALTVPAAVPA